MKYLQLIRKKLLPLLLSVAVIGSQVPVMAGDFDAEETKESIAAVSSGESDDKRILPKVKLRKLQRKQTKSKLLLRTAIWSFPRRGQQKSFLIPRMIHSETETVKLMKRESNISRDALLQRKNSRNSWLPSIICLPIPKPLRLAMILRKSLWEELFPIHLIIMRHSRGM